MKNTQKYIRQTLPKKSKSSIPKFIFNLGIVGLLTLSAMFVGFGTSQLSAVNSSTPISMAESSQSQTTPISYLTAPKLIETDGRNLFLYDSYTKLLSVIDPITKTKTLSTQEEKEVLEMHYSGKNLYALIENDNQTSIYKVVFNANTISYSKITTSLENIKHFSAKSEEVSEDTTQDYLYLYSLDGMKIECVQPDNTTTVSRSILPTVYDKNSIENLFIIGNDIYCAHTSTIDQTSGSTILKLVLDNISNDYIKSSNDVVGFKENTNYLDSCIYNAETLTTATALTSDGKITIIDGTSPVKTQNLLTLLPTEYQNVNIKFSSIAQIDNKIYLTEPTLQVIFELNTTTDELKVFMSNTTPTPTILSVTDHIYIELTGTGELFASPFAIVPTVVAKSGTSLVVLQNTDPAFEDFYYCLYTERNQNYYLYLKKSTPHTTLPKTVVNTPAKVLGSSSTPIFSLPTTTTDQNNTIIESLKNDDNITQTLVQVVKNSHGESFYVVSTPSGNTGYIRYTQTTSAFSQIATAKIKCDGRTKRDTILYLAPSTDTEISYTDEEIAEFEQLQVDNNTRIKLLESINAGNTYTRVTYQPDSGEIYTGYIKTADIKSDALTPLQIIGIILVIVNIILLIIIVVFRKSLAGKPKKEAQSEN